MFTESKFARLFPVILLALVGLQGCVAALLNLPTPEEEKALLKSHIDESSRIAVVTMQFGSYKLPRNGFGEHLVEATADVARETFGAEVVALDQSEGGEWARELQRINDDGDSLDGESHAEYFRSRGFDAWILVSTTGEGAITGQEGGNASWVYDPSTRIFTVNGAVHRQLLYWSAKRFTAACAINGRLIFNYKKEFEIVYPGKCASDVANGFRRELTETLAL